jgi:hypothetical protein
VTVSGENIAPDTAGGQNALRAVLFRALVRRPRRRFASQSRRMHSMSSPSCSVIIQAGWRVEYRKPASARPLAELAGPCPVAAAGYALVHSPNTGMAHFDAEAATLSADCSHEVRTLRTTWAVDDRSCRAASRSPAPPARCWDAAPSSHRIQPSKWFRRFSGSAARRESMGVRVRCCPIPNISEKSARPKLPWTLLRTSECGRSRCSCC